MKIAYFTESLPPNMDGVSHTLIQISRFMESRGVEFRFLSPFIPDKSHFLSNRVRKVRSIPFPMYTAYRISFPLFENLDDYLDGFSPDIVHVVSPTPLCIYGLKYARNHDLPAVGSYHTNFVSYFKYYGFGKLEGLGWKYLRWFYNQCGKTFVPSQSVQEDLTHQGIHNVELLPHGIDTQRFSPDFRSSRIRRLLGGEDLPVLLFVGRLVKEKDLADLIQAFTQLQSQGYRFRAVFVGDGPMRQDLARQLPEAHFTGTLSGSELSQWYASSDLFVFPSTTETFGLVVQEAFASGIPVVGVRQGGVADLIQDGVNGFLAEPNRPADLAEKVAALLDNASLRTQLGANARSLVMEHSWDKVNQQLLESYRSLVDPPSSNGKMAEPEAARLVPTDSGY